MATEKKTKPRKQCKKCPWRKDVNPRDIPNGYEESLHCSLQSTIAKPGELNLDGVRVMACHESPIGKEIACVGWLDNQLGPGNNIGLRLAVRFGRIDANVETVGEQHARFEDTLPKDGFCEPCNGSGVTGPELFECGNCGGSGHL